MNLIKLAERGILPDWAIRTGIQQMLSTRSKSERKMQVESHRNQVAKFVDELQESPIAVCTDHANHQHYEIPAEFYQLVLGPQLKYSCCYWPDGCNGLAEAEREMLALTCERAQINNGMRVLDLGCGWGSLTIWIAKHFPGCHVTALSNSHGQRKHIQERCHALGLTNVEVITADICEFETSQLFDRIISIEMFEHLRNYHLLLSRISNWLHDNGKLFVHLFCHSKSPYIYETEGDANWMGRHFFTGGMMPSDDLLLYFQNDLAIQEHWRVNGMHYALTCDEWLMNLDNNRHEIETLFASAVDPSETRISVQRWRMFFMACAELFRYNGGNEWFVSHYLFKNKAISRNGKLQVTTAIQ